MIETGRVCIKIAGRDAGKTAVVVQKINDITVMVDGNARRKKCNIKHLEPTDKVLNIKEKATTEEVLSAMKDSGLAVEKKPKAKEAPKEEKPAAKKKTKTAKK